MHLVEDEKFIDMAWREFEAAAPGQNLVVIAGETSPLQFIHEAPVRFCPSDGLGDLIRSSSCKSVIFHSLRRPALMKHIPDDVSVIWVGWGFDYYARLLSGAYPDGLFMPATKRLVTTYNRGVLRIADRIVVNVIRLWRKMFSPDLSENEESILRRVDYFAPVLDTEYEMAIQLNDWFKPKYLEWNYGNAEDDLAGPDQASEGIGDNILVGNCADPANNHLEVFDSLERFVDIGDREIIVPLSYGEAWYRDKIIAHGQRRFGKNFRPLVDFLDADSYGEILGSCGFVFMNHLRQAALGNICMSILRGATVFLHPGSPVYRWLRGRGCSLESVQALQEVGERQKLQLRHLPPGVQQANAQVIMDHWGRDTKRTKTQGFAKIALSGD